MVRTNACSLVLHALGPVSIESTIKMNITPFQLMSQITLHFFKDSNESTNAIFVNLKQNIEKWALI